MMTLCPKVRLIRSSDCSAQSSRSSIPPCCRPSSTSLCVILLSLSTMRKPEEFYFDKHVMDRIVENHFDSSHNTFESVRRVGDIQSGATPSCAGPLRRPGPCNDVGYRTTNGACEDDVWPDGDGSFHLSGASRYEINVCGAL